MCSARGCCGFATADFSIRKSPDQRLLTASRGLSQFPTSFIGVWRQGIHRKPLVASPRDAEKLILFLLAFGLQFYVIHYSVGKVLFAVDQRAMLSTFVKGIARPSTHIRFSNFDKATRLIAGPRKSVAIVSLQYSQKNADRQIFSFTALTTVRSCGDDGIRTRGLRLAKALLSH